MRKLREVVANVRTCLGVEVCCAAQGIDLRAEVAAPSDALGAVHAAVRAAVPMMNVDREVAEQIAIAKVCDLETADAFIGRVMRRMGSAALVLVPIVAHDHYYGFISVSVAERSERLHLTRALDEALAGIAAHAATALDNARLIETMAHQARHDSLTGLLSHRAFQESLEEGVRNGGQRTFTLALIVHGVEFRASWPSEEVREHAGQSSTGRPACCSPLS